MATYAIALGASISAAIAAGAAGDTYTLAAGIYYGQTFSPKVGDTYKGASGGGTVISGARLLTSWANQSANWYKATQGRVDVQATVTVTSASPGVVTWTSSNFAAGQRVAITSTATMPTGITSGQTYYVIATGLGANSFQISATPGGTAINTSSTGTGTLTGSAAGGGALTNFPLPNNTPDTLWRGTATISTTTLTVVSTTAGTFTTPASGGVIYGNGLAAATRVTAGTGPFTITPSQTVAVARPMILVDQHYENQANGVAPNDPLAYLSEELFVDGVRYTRIQAAAVPVAPGVGEWFWDFADSSININLASPTTHLIEYSCTQCMCNMGAGSAWTMRDITFEKYAWWEQGAILCYPDGAVNLYNCTGRFNAGCAVNINSNYLGIFGGHYTDNGCNGIIGGFDRGFIIGAEISRNNPGGAAATSRRFNIGWQAGGIKLNAATDSIVLLCTVNDNGGPGIWNDSFSLRNVIGKNYCMGNIGPGIMDEISTLAKIYDNDIFVPNMAENFALCGIFVSNSSNVEVYNNRITLGTGHTGGRIAGGISSYNGVRGNSQGQPASSFRGSISAATLTVGSVCTVTSATPAVVTMTTNPHFFVAGQPIIFSNSGGGLPTGITAATTYYVIATGLTSSTFQFSATLGGSAVNTSSTGTGTHTCVPALVTSARLFGVGISSGTFLLSGSGTTWTLSFPQPTIAAELMMAVWENNNVVCECRNLSIHHNTVTHLDAIGNYDGFASDQAIVGGSNNYRDFNAYYTPNNTSQYWYRTTDAAVNTAYTWAAYQAAGFEPNSTNVVGVAPGIAVPANPSPYLRAMQGPVTLVALDISTVTTGGTAVNAFSAGHVTAGGRIQNPPTALTSLGINQSGTASGTADNGGTRFYKPGAFCWLTPSANAVSVISSDSAHPFAGEGWT